jgi:hypothetical protein
MLLVSKRDAKAYAIKKTHSSFFLKTQVGLWEIILLLAPANSMSRNPVPISPMT